MKVSVRPRRPEDHRPQSEQQKAEGGGAVDGDGIQGVLQTADALAAPPAGDLRVKRPPAKAPADRPWPVRRPGPKGAARTMPSASRPAWAYISSGLSWSWKMSGRVRVRIFRPAVERAAPGQEVQDEGAEAADGPLLHRDQGLVVAGQPQDQLLVQRLGEAGVGDRGRQAARGQQIGGAQHFLQPGAQGQDGHRRSLTQDAAAADLQRQGRLGNDRRRRLRRAGSGSRSGRSSMATEVATIRARSASSPAAISTKPGSWPR